MLIPNNILTVEETLSGDVDKMRCRAFPENYSDAVTSYDEYDDRSLHLVGRSEDNVACYVRLTPSADGVFQNWFQGSTSVEFSYDSVDLNRLFTSCEYRRCCFAELMMIRACLLSASMGYKQAIGSVIPESSVSRLCEHLGFRPCGNRLLELEPGGNELIVQPLVMDIEACSDHLHACWQTLMARITRYRIVDACGFDIATVPGI